MRMSVSIVPSLVVFIATVFWSDAVECFRHIRDEAGLILDGRHGRCRTGNKNCGQPFL